MHKIQDLKMTLSFLTPEWNQSGDDSRYILNSRHVLDKMLGLISMMHSAR